MRERELQVPLGRIAALGNDGRGPRVLALHGWLDNAASFLPMAPFLGTLELVAIDLPGHGRSAHLPAGADYSFPGAIASVLDVADALGWERFALLGHSMGAGIASLVAAACPQRVEKLVAIEALGALTDPAGHALQRMREAVAAERATHGKQLRVFPDVDTAVRTRMQAGRVPGSGLDATLVRLLVERGLMAVEGGFAWSSDRKLTLPSFTRMTEPQVEAVVAGIECPTLAIFADPAQPYLADDVRRRRAALLPRGELLVLPGGHHLHMDQPQRVGTEVARFLAA